MTGGQSVLSIDTVDDRRELHHLLSKLSPRKRVDFLKRCCARCKSKMGPVEPNLYQMAPRVRAALKGCEKADHGLTRDIIGDLLMLAYSYDLDLTKVVVDLERTVRRPGTDSGR